MIRYTQQLLEDSNFLANTKRSIVLFLCPHTCKRATVAIAVVTSAAAAPPSAWALSTAAAPIRDSRA